MGKVKIHSGATKRFKKTGSGLKRKRAGKNHILTKRTTKNKRQLRGTVPIAKKRHKKILKQAKGYRGARSRTFKVAKQAVQRAGQYAYRDRRVKKRTFRSLWIIRINAAARENGLSYSKLISGLKKANIDLDRKTLADIAVNDKEAFSLIAEQAKSNLAA